MYMLVEHPDIENRLRQEVFDKVGPTGRPTYDSMREMRFMRAFLNGNDYFLPETIHSDFFGTIFRGPQALPTCVS
jgi:hypothetical protein